MSNSTVMKLKPPFFIIGLLLPDVGSYLRKLKANCRYCIASGPEVLSSKVSLSSTELPCYGNCAFPFQKSYNRSHRILRWYADAHMDVVRHQMPFYYCALFLLCQFVKQCSQMFSDFPKQRFAASFWDKYNVILAIPARMRQAFIRLSHFSSFGATHRTTL